MYNILIENNGLYVGELVADSFSIVEKNSLMITVGGKNIFLAIEEMEGTADGDIRIELA